MLNVNPPLIEIGAVPELFADCIGPVQVIGSVFWVSFCRLQVPAGMTSMARVPIIRIGRALSDYHPGELARLIGAARHPSSEDGRAVH
jgi:hypothetical protein